MPIPTARTLRPRRRGSIVVLAAFLLVGLCGVVMLAVDVGYLMIARTDLQRTADAAAHAAVLEYRSTASVGWRAYKARVAAASHVANNKILNASPSVSMNYWNSASGDIVVGKIDFDHPRNPMTFASTSQYNAIKVRVRRSADKNGEVPLFFAKLFGRDSLGMEAEATAAIIANVGGFKIPPSGLNAPILPITIKQEYWDEQLSDLIDEWKWDPSDQTVSDEYDGIPEVILFPNDTESSGNFGTVNIGTSANSASFLGGQIRNGVSQADLDYHGGSLALNSYGELPLGGDPGLSASIKDDLDHVTGEARVIPLYREVSENGNNGVYVVVKWVGVRIMAVQLTGGEKFVAVQPANMTYDGVVQASTSGASDQIYSPPVIVQ